MLQPWCIGHKRLGHKRPRRVSCETRPSEDDTRDSAEQTILGRARMVESSAEAEDGLLAR
jgi:hypothetical protein